MVATARDLSPAPARPFRRVRFSLRAAVCVLTLFAVGMGGLRFFQRRVEHQIELDALFMDLGMAVKREPVELSWIDDLPGGPFHIGPIQKLTLARNAGSPTGIPVPALWNVPGNRQGFLRALDELNQLQEIRLSGAFIDDEIAARLVGLKQLEKAEFCYTTLTDAGLKSLGQLTSLTYLDLHDAPNITNAGLLELGSLEKLESLSLASCPQLTGSGVARLTALANLQRLRLGWDFDDTDLAALPKLTQLQEFHIGSTHITPRGEAWLRGQFPVVQRHFPARSAYGNPFEDSPGQQGW